MVLIFQICIQNLTNEEVLSIVKELPLYVALTLKRFNSNKRKNMNMNRQQRKLLAKAKSSECQENAKNKSYSLSRHESMSHEELIDMTNIKVKKK